jgi:hypothetical protein
VVKKPQSMWATQDPRVSERAQLAAKALRTVEILTELGSIDWSFSDLYHERAESVLSPVCSRDQFRDLVLQGDRLDQISVDLERALGCADWRRVQTLAREGNELRTRAHESAHVMEVAAHVYRGRPLDVRMALLSLGGIGTLPAAQLRAELALVIERLGTLADSDPSQADFYRRRVEHYSGLAFDESSSPDRVASEELLSVLRDAAGKRDFTRVERLAKAAAQEHRDAHGRVRIRRPSEEVERRLRASLPSVLADEARRLGLEPRSLPAAPELNSYLSCTCSERADLLDSNVEPGPRPASACTCGHPCPPGVRPSLKDNLDLLMAHVFVSSAGARYLPWFGGEHLLVESFPEESPSLSGALLDRLELPGRTGLSRLAVENALLSHGPRLCREIGLDPFEFKLVCIPFDVFLRLAPELGWGRSERWTHFDGYQVTRELRLLGLFGGDVRFGGPDDLCSIGRDYESDRVLLRLAIVRRERLTARASAEPR